MPANDRPPCPKKGTIDNQARDAQGHINKVLADPALSANLKNELGLAIKDLDSIMADHHHL
jgi:hypothetical protein